MNLTWYVYINKCILSLSYDVTCDLINYQINVRKNVTSEVEIFGKNDFMILWKMWNKQITGNFVIAQDVYAVEKLLINWLKL